MNAHDDATDPAKAESATGFPGVASWRSVYLIVVAIFAIYVVLLTVLSRAFQ
jgi:hypothetical protein